MTQCVCLPVVSKGCPWMWDNLTCWQPARIGEVVEVNCPELFSQFMSEEDYGQLPMTSHTQLPLAANSVDFIGLFGAPCGLDCIISDIQVLKCEILAPFQCIADLVN